MNAGMVGHVNDPVGRWVQALNATNHLRDYAGQTNDADLAAYAEQWRAVLDQERTRILFDELER